MKLSLSDAITQVNVRRDLVVHWGGFVLGGTMRTANPEPARLLEHRNRGESRAIEIAKEVSAQVDQAAPQEWHEGGAGIQEILDHTSKFEVAYVRRVLMASLELLPPEERP
jgi:hypothetical protein